MPVIAIGARPPADAGGAARIAALSATVPARTLFGVLVAIVALPQPLLWLFLGFAPWAVAGGIAAVGAVALGFARTIDGEARVSLVTIGQLGLLTLVLFVLGGEGRFFYANTDWMVRDAVLRDLVGNPWPFAYPLHPPVVLRAPLGLYLLPALVGKAAGYRAAEFAMLAQNAAMLTCLLAVGATLFERGRARRLALIVVVLFSGMDVIGALIVGYGVGGHLEWWAGPQFSSHVTQAFWVPQHGIAGWTGALAYLLWREDRLAPAGMLLVVPLAALWSPLAAIGLLPFAAHAGLATIARRRLTPACIALPAFATLLAVPGLLYMAAGSGAVGGGGSGLAAPIYLLFELMEAIPFLVVAAALGRNARFGGITLAIVAVFLLAAPYVQVGHYVDFVMRASIPSLAILAVIVADALIAAPVKGKLPVWRPLLIAVFAAGAVTPLSEIGRALTLPPSPAPLCSYMGVVPGGDPTYDVPLEALPRLVRPEAPAIAQLHDPKRCWARPWPIADQFGMR